MILITEIFSGCLDKNDIKRWYRIFSSCPCIYKEDRKDENNCRPIIYRSFKNIWKMYATKNWWKLILSKF